MACDARTIYTKSKTMVIRLRSEIRLILLLVLLTTPVSYALAASPLPDGAALFAAQCASCHDQTQGARAPSRAMLKGLAPNAILASLINGKMAQQGARLTTPQRDALAYFLTGRTNETNASATHPACTTGDSLAASNRLAAWNGWGNSLRNARFQPEVDAGVSAAELPRLKLAWAFGFPDASSARTQPTVIGRWLFTAGDNGDVYALDAKTGCLRWKYRARAAVRSALAYATSSSAGSVAHTVYFGDAQANAYALNAETGAPVWTRKIEQHPNGWITGSPKVYQGRVYFTVSAALEEVGGSNPDYACCTFRGSVAALDAATGATLWQTYSIAQPPVARTKNSRGVQQYGPAGAGIWNSPTIDVKRGLLYVGTGNGFADPPQPTIDSILAFDLFTGAMRWHFQATPGDVWLWQCDNGAKTRTDNCPATQGPDYDFGSAPILVTTPNGKELLVVPQKSGMLWALDPDQRGKLVWQYRIGEGAAIAGQWGAAADGLNVYVGSSTPFGKNAGGMHAVALETGQRAWHTPAPAKLCEGGEKELCLAGQGAAVSVIPGVLFAGSFDGGFRAYDTAAGKMLWQYDTNRYFETVNGVIAKGGTMDASGPVIANGMVFVNSGYNLVVGRAGNVLLAFAAE
jgi:polyvinyl alcohol dehydrogenase (cytochrome)